MCIYSFRQSRMPKLASAASTAHRCAHSDKRPDLCVSYIVALLYHLNRKTESFDQRVFLSQKNRVLRTFPTIIFYLSVCHG